MQNVVMVTPNVKFKPCFIIIDEIILERKKLCKNLITIHIDIL